MNGMLGRWIDKRAFSKYKIDIPTESPSKQEMSLSPDLVRLSITNASIKYGKDKIVASIYFLTTLTLIFYAIFQYSFQSAIGIEGNYYLADAIALSVAGMAIITSWIVITECQRFSQNLQIQALFFEYMQRGLGDTMDWALIRAAIEQDDWNMAKKIIDDGIRLRRPQDHRYRF